MARYILISAIFIGILFALVFAAEQERVAVLDFRNPDKAVTNSEANYITEMVRTEARKMLPRERYVLMTKENIQQMLPPDKRNLAECEGECEVETGRLIGAQYLVTGEVVRFGGELRVTVRLYDVASGNLLESRNAAGKNVLDLESPFKQVASVLFAVLPGAYRQPTSTPVPAPVYAPTPEPFVPPANADPAFEKLVKEEQARIEAERRLAAEQKGQLDADYSAVKGIHDSQSYSDDAKKAAYEKFVGKWSQDTTYAPSVKQWLSAVGSVEGMVRIPGGTFWMGCSSGDTECEDDEKPQHKVTLKGFFIDTHEVTNRQYRECVSAGTCEASKYQDDSKWNGLDKPVVGVLWNDAGNYCRWKGGRLPTEAEWEYAARGGTTSARYGNLDSIAWNRGNSGGKTHPVGQKQPNAYGLYDILGNVWEWNQDWYDKGWYARMPEQNPLNSQINSFRVIRGGSWFDFPRYFRASYRNSFNPTYSYSYVGFRCSRD